MMSYIMNGKKDKRGVRMKQMSRREAEALFHRSKIISTDIEQDTKEMRILLTLSNDCGFLVKYDLVNHKKSYFFIRVQR